MSSQQYFYRDERIEMMSIRQGDVDMHHHDFLEMAYVAGGSAIHTLNDTQTTVRAGDYFIINYGAEHKYTLIHQQPFDLINILFKPDLIDKSLRNCRSFQEVINHYLIRMTTASLEKNPTDVIFRDNDGTILSLVKQMQAEYDRKEAGHIELLRCYMIEIIVRTLRTISRKPPKSSSDDSTAFILDYVDKQYMNPITLSEICKQVNFSLPYLCRKFKQDTGYTFVAYLQQKRMEQSGRLLVNSDKKVGEIAGLVGYQDVKFFNAVFKKHWGMTPGEFRRLYLSVDR